MVFEYTHSEISVAIFTAARLSPMMLGPVSGVISDRFDRPKLLLVASGWAFVMMVLIATPGRAEHGQFLGAGFRWLLHWSGAISLATGPVQPGRRFCRA
ncbi:MFS transporter [Ochrobactrum cytisi]|nr:MFS transporter [Brucella cytisi]